MKKRERIATVNQAMLRASANLTNSESLAKEIEAGVTGTITPDEGTKLIEKSKWNPDVLQVAVNLGLVREKVRKTRTGVGGVRVGNIQAQFAEKHVELFNGQSKLDSDGTQLMEEWVKAYGIRNAFSTVRHIVRKADEDFSVGIYFIPAKKEEAPATA